MADKANRKREKKKTFGAGMIGLVLFSVVFLAVSALLSYVSLVRHGSQLFADHEDVQLPDFVGLPSVPSYPE